MFRTLSTAVLLLLFALPGIALAQGTGTLAGTVIDASTGETLINANVRIEGTTLGAATNIDGEYRIIGVPVGTYTVTASYIGYGERSIEEVTINNGYTRQLDFQLSSDNALGEVVVEYERPIIQRDAIGTPRVVSGEDLENLPIRSVTGVTALQGGVVSTDNSSTLNIRGGRGEEVQYFVDGVRVSGLIGVNQQAIQEQEVLIGTIPARYGDVQSGVISITTKTGRQDFFGSAELITSEVLDAYGYNVASLSLGGPVLPGRLGFFASGEYNYERDSNPYGIESFRLSDESYDALQQNPQVLLVRNADGTSGFVNFPVDLVSQGGIDRDSLQALLLSNGTLTEGQRLSSAVPQSRAEQFTASDFERSRGKDSPISRLTLNGNLNFDLGTVNLRVGGGYITRDNEEFSYTSSLYNRDRFYNDERDEYRVYGTLRQRISNTAFFQIQGEFQDNQYVQYPNGFSSNLEDVLLYGDASNPINDVSSRYYIYRDETDDDVDNPTYVQQFNEDSGNRPVRVGGNSFSLPGRLNTNNFQQAHDQRYRFQGNATTQLGVHQIEFGGEYQQDTRRFFSINAFGLAGYVNDSIDGVEDSGNEIPVPGGMFPDGINTYDQLPYQAVRDIATYYGYNYLGTQEVNEQDINAFFNTELNTEESKRVDAYRPRYYAGYIQDKIEFRDLIIQLGMRVDVFDNNTQVLLDVFAPDPIFRASSLDNVPNGIENDFAVYYNGDNVVGYRDLDGTFYDTEGTEVPSRQIITDRRGQVRLDTEADRSTAFTEYDPQVTVMPRVGVSFPVTDRALFFASYNVTSQRPTENAFTPLSSFVGLTGQNRISNPTLEPERTTQYEIGFRQRVGERAAIQISGFYRTQDNKIQVGNVQGGFPQYSTYFNSDFTTTQGAEFNFDLRRINNLSVNANYTLSFAQGTGSDSNTAATAAWRGNYFPNTIGPADFDQRHTANVTLDYRFGAGEGPMVGNVRPFENFGVNVIGQFGSGLRYTRLEPNQNFSVNDSFTEGVNGTINGATLPATSRIDLRVDRAFNLGFNDSRLRAYVSVINLFDTQNILGVYRSTGLVNEDGFINTTAGQAQLDTPGRLFNYQAYIGGPVNVGGSQSTSGSFYGSPRQIRLGFLFDF